MSDILGPPTEGVGTPPDTEQAAESVEWGVVVDDLGSTDMAESEAEARAWFAAGEGKSLVRLVVTEWSRNSTGTPRPAGGA